MSAISIYKKGQGYYVRLCSAIALGMLVLLGAKWVADAVAQLDIERVESAYVEYGAALGVIIVFALLGFWLIGRKPRVVDFMIACEGEMKKVNWSTRREILGSTWVVIALTIFIAAFCLSADLVFQSFFQFIGVLETG